MYIYIYIYIKLPLITCIEYTLQRKTRSQRVKNNYVNVYTKYKSITNRQDVTLYRLLRFHNLT